MTHQTISMPSEKTDDYSTSIDHNVNLVLHGHQTQIRLSPDHYPHSSRDAGSKHIKMADEPSKISAKIATGTFLAC